tara:strand:- start:3205 stop:3606 length:402 start_codon:yes stop_codon:yes gene_type:complete
MYSKDTEISKLSDLDKLRSAPSLNKKQSSILLAQIKLLVFKADWVTIGVMSPSLSKAINAVRRIEEKFKYKEMKCINFPSQSGPIFLKANQKTGEIHARIEYGLGEGILISCHNDDNSQTSKTIGPFPLDFFN